MAMPACMSDDGNPAVFVGTMLQTGDAFTLCEDCFGAWVATIFAGLSGIELGVAVRMLTGEAEVLVPPGEDTPEEHEQVKKAAAKRSRRRPGPTPNGTSESTGQGDEDVGEGATPESSEAPAT